MTTLESQNTLKAVFFDIDGTLLDLHGAGRRAFARTLEKMFGWSDTLEYIQFAGATDLDVLRQILAGKSRVADQSVAEEFFALLPEELYEEVRVSRCTVFQGVQQLVDRLSVRSDILLGLITGNIEECAHIKLDRAGLGGSFMLGAFGHEHADRNEIARLGMHRIREAIPEGERLGKIYLIGDTPSDIQAAHAISATAIAVATGKFSVSDLKNAGADMVVTSLDVPELEVLFE